MASEHTPAAHAHGLWPRAARRGRRAALVLLVAAAVGGCAAMAPQGPRDTTRALASAKAVSDRSFQQVLTVRYGERERRMIAAGHVCAGELVLSLLTPQGIELARLYQRGRTLEVEHARGLPDAIRPRAILADFQLAHWPVTALRGAWGPGWSLERSPGVRRASYRGTLSVSVRYEAEPWVGTAELTHHRLDYALIIRTIRHRPGPRRAGCTEPQ